MAIDTAEKRRGAASWFSGIGVPGVTPNSDKDAEWRRQAAWGYSGVVSDAVAVVYGYCVVATQAFSAGAVASNAYIAGAATEQTFSAGAAAAEAFSPGAAVEQTFNAGGVITDHC